MLCFTYATSPAQLKTYTFPQIDSLQKINPRTIVIFIHTDWCVYCQSMKQITFKKEEVWKILNEKFWFASLDAEEKKEIFFNGHTFKYKPTGNNTGMHELAEQLVIDPKKAAYPAISVLNNQYEIIFQSNEYLSAVDFLSILQSFSSD